ncbi:MAG: glycerol-3-phosphate 1-O-acyltransferase PlsB [Pseudomonadota bacterium]
MSALHRGLTSLMSLWVRPQIMSDEVIDSIRALAQQPGTRLCYVLESGGLADTLTLARACQQQGLPSPIEDIRINGSSLGRALVVLRRMRGFLFRRRSIQQSKRLMRLAELAVQMRDTSQPQPDEVIVLVPVGIYWGKAPAKTHSWFRLILADGWEVAGRIRKFIITLALGRQTLLNFSQPMMLAPLLEDGEDAARILRKTSRVLRVHFRRRRVATVGPDLSHKRTLINTLLMDEPVRRAIAAAGEPGTKAYRRAEAKARQYALEIAADLSYSMIRILERVLTWLWQRIYDGVEVSGMQRLKQVADGSELVYVPCHRSHFDYLLLSYVLYKQGLSLPYIAAGINLNLPVVGPLLRRGGAFFLRRSFSGNRLYAAVFHAYLKALQTRGYPLEYFIEGGRSRTGRLLSAKGGMLSMSVQAFAEHRRRPVKFVPVYFGYERLIEGTSFISELRGDEKKKESLFGLIRSLRALRQTFGQVYVNVGEPVDLEALMDRVAPAWRDTPVEHAATKPVWLTTVVDELGETILERINDAAAVTPISLLAMALLHTPRQAMSESDLVRQISLYQTLYQRTPYSAFMTSPQADPKDIIAHGLELDVIRREAHELGSIIVLPERQALLSTYFRNNVLHLTAVHSLIAACLAQDEQLSRDDILSMIEWIAPYVRAELRWSISRDALRHRVNDALNLMLELGLVEAAGDGRLQAPQTGSALDVALARLGEAVIPMLQRYYITVALLQQKGSGQLSQPDLEKLCELCAQRLSILSGFRAPDFFDRRLFRTFVSALRDEGVVSADDAGLLGFEIDFDSIDARARYVLGEALRHSILSITHGSAGDQDDTGAPLPKAANA